MKRLAVAQASSTRNAMAKELYVRLFGYIVSKLNRLLQPPSAAAAAGNAAPASAASAADVLATIGILDIFGFESFESNDFEQVWRNTLPNSHLSFLAFRF